MFRTGKYSSCYSLVSSIPDQPLCHMMKTLYYIGWRFSSLTLLLHLSTLSFYETWGSFVVRMKKTRRGILCVSIRSQVRVGEMIPSGLTFFTRKKREKATCTYELLVPPTKLSTTPSFPYKRTWQAQWCEVVVGALSVGRLFFLYFHVPSIRDCIEEIYLSLDNRHLAHWNHILSLINTTKAQYFLHIPIFLFIVFCKNTLWEHLRWEVKRTRDKMMV